MSLDNELAIPPDYATKAAIKSALWATNAEDITTKSAFFSAFFEYYTRQCRDLSLDDLAVRWTHNDVCDVARYIRGTMSREGIVEALNGLLAARTATTPEDSQDVRITDAVQELIDLVARLISMTTIGDPKTRRLAGTKLDWKTGSLQAVLSQRFVPQKKLHTEGIRLEPLFNARNFRRIAGLEIVWTSNLVDHLFLSHDNAKVSIFHHAAFLEQQRAPATSVLPDKLAEETLRTLAMLFPQANQDVVEWYTKLADQTKLKIGLDPRACEQPSLKSEERQIEYFEFWRDRLVVLKRAFDDSDPRHARQLLSDRRKRNQWYTFWVAVIVLILTIFFGAAQTLLSAIQVYKAYHPS